MSFASEVLLSPAWKLVREHVEQRLSALRSKLEANLDQTETATVRGRIRELKLLLDTSESSLGEIPAKKVADTG